MSRSAIDAGPSVSSWRQREPEINFDIDLVLDADAWSRAGIPHKALGRIRENRPVFKYEGGTVDPFWLITRHADIEEISRDSSQWLNAPRTTLQRKKGEPKQLNSLPQMDAPEHPLHRRAIHQWLIPRRIRRLEDRMAEVARGLIDELAESGGDVDLVPRLAAPHPLRMICEILGVPEDEYGQVLKLSKSLFAPLDPDGGGDREYAMTIDEIMAYCGTLVARRRAEPGDDLVSAIIAADVGGAPMQQREILSHLVVLIAAGHDTTASAVSGGILAMINNQAQWAKLKAHPGLLPQAIEEMIRFVTPTTNFMRTAVNDREVNGVLIPAGDDVCLHYAAANRDPRAFSDPDQFIIDRSPNRHLGFGTGAHVCIGQVLARVEMKALFTALLSRVENIELRGDPSWMRAFWISALKTLPVQVRFKK